MDKIKVLHLVEAMETGGIENLVAGMARNMDPARFDIAVRCVSSGGDVAELLADEGRDVEVLGIRTYHNPLNIISLAAELRKVSPDILHTHGYYSSTIGRLAAPLSGIPVVVSHVHSTYWDYSERNLAIERILSYVSDKVICCSEAVNRFVVDVEGVSPEKTVTIYNGVEDIDPPPVKGCLRAALGIADSTIVVASVGSLYPHKGHEHLLNAFASAIEGFWDMLLLVAGEGPTRAGLEKIVKEKGLSEKVHFLGKRNDVPDIMVDSDIVAVPSSGREGFSLVAAEAMSFCRPVVATNIGGIPEVVWDGTSGLLSDPGNEKAMSEHIKELAGSSAMRERMGHAGRRIFEDMFSIEKLTTKIGCLYEGLILGEQG